MDLKDQLKNLFPDHEPEENPEEEAAKPAFWIQDEPLKCKYEKRRGKPVTIIEGYRGADTDFKKMTRELKNLLGVGGSYKNDTIILQGDFRDKIMEWLKNHGFQVKRVGG